MALLVVTGLAATACEAPEEAPAVSVLRAPPETTMIPVRRVPRLVAHDSLPSRIFYDLTRFEWYARGEPLSWAGFEWQPAGNPVAIETETLRLLGDFDGVDLWTPAQDDSLTVLYVPVSEGWWLPFRARGPS